MVLAHGGRYVYQSTLSDCLRSSADLLIPCFDVFCLLPWPGRFHEEFCGCLHSQEQSLHIKAIGSTVVV